MPICLNCNHSDLAHPERHLLAKNKKCSVCPCEEFKMRETDIVSVLAYKIGYNNKWAMIRSFGFDAAVLVAIYFLAQVTASSTCVGGMIPLDVYQECFLEYRNGTPRVLDPNEPMVQVNGSIEYDYFENIFNKTIEQN